ncbi:hypothetical protein RCO27_17950 [Sphingosinicella sp. LHD-64]|uniref:PAS domain-containing protein n=1 Tax=Sphingosinicella sp. LHD-64 TaxID=3072139 RepID=UPI00280FD80F|nr:hypothetical protein [Sphingosinicella sp. LHD-64]MDQ8758113.1 hypothetical protein [Sphingosinicella sp. LHD-64]
MDSFRGFEDETALTGVPEEEPAMEAPPEIGVDERRMHVRAYNYWVSLLDGRAYPSIEDIDPHSLADFGPHSVLVDFSKNEHDPAIAFLGAALRDECGLDQDLDSIGQVPSRSLLSRLTDHYLQIIANSAPIGFEAEFVSHRGHNTLYRGILMPFSSNGEAIDFIYGVINWKEVADGEMLNGIHGEVGRAIAAAPAPSENPVWADGPHADFDAHAIEAAPEPLDDATLSLWPEADGLADRLVAARESAEAARGDAQRSRSALYRAIGLAHDFALATQDDPEGYAELLEDAGLKVQARAPMTPIVKLVFGVGYDKTRLTEFAAALAWAERSCVPAGAFAELIERHDGGLKAIVAEERAFRRPAPKPDRWTEIRAELQARPPLARVDIAVDGTEEFVLLVARREGEGLAIVAPIADPRLVDQALRKTAA